MAKGKEIIGEFGEQFMQFKHKPKDAIKHLKKVKKGECIAALSHPEIGDIDIVWGVVTDKVKHTGYGLSHIIDKHGAEIKSLGFEVEDFIPIVVQFGELSLSKTKEEYLLESKHFRVVIEKSYKGRKKQWLLTAFDLRKKPRK